MDRISLIVRCRRDLEGRRSGYLAELASLDEAAAGETKSSAGDKYETARERIAQSRDILARNLLEVEDALRSLDRMANASPAGNPTGDGPHEDRIRFGSLVETSQGWYLAGVSIGEIDATQPFGPIAPSGAPESPDSPGKRVRTLTLASPLGQALRGRRAGDSVPWRGGVLEILRVLH